jgi:hypothetical protein
MKAKNKLIHIRQLLSTAENGLRNSKMFVPTNTHSRIMLRRGIMAIRILKKNLLNTI